MKTEPNSHGKQFVDLRGQMESLYTQAFGSVCSSDSESALLEEIRSDNRYTMLRTIAEGGAKFIHLVEDGVTGYHVPVEDPIALSKNISRLLEDKALRYRMGHDAFAFAKKFDWSNISKQMIEVYRELLPE